MSMVVNGRFLTLSYIEGPLSVSLTPRVFAEWLGDHEGATDVTNIDAHSVSA